MDERGSRKANLAMPHYDTYAICATTRSGSTLLCGLLAATGVAGHPDSYFHRPSVAIWADRLGVDMSADAPEAELREAALAAAIQKGRAGSDVFAVRVMRQSFDYLLAQLAARTPDATSDLARIEAAFGRTLFVHLTRSDKVAQAVSFVRAEQEGLWHRAPDGSELERQGAGASPAYDPTAIEAQWRTLVQQDQAWAAWFAAEGISPLTIEYSELAANPVAPLQAVLARLGLDPAAADGIAPHVDRLADDLSSQWIARFRQESGLS